MGRTNNSLRSARWTKRTLSAVCRVPTKFLVAYLHGLQLLRTSYTRNSAQRRSILSRRGIHQRKPCLGKTQARDRKDISIRGYPRSASVHGVKPTVGENCGEDLNSHLRTVGARVSEVRYQP